MVMGVNQNVPAGAIVTQVPSGTKNFSKVAPPASPSQILVLAANSSRISVLIVNAGTQICYVGKDATVDASTGMPLAAGLSIFDDVTTDAWWASAASGTGDLRVLEVVRGGS